MRDCVFCRMVAGSSPAWIVHETETTLAFLDANPVAAYHTLVVPKDHHVSLFDVPADILRDVMATVKHIVDLYHDVLGLENVQIVNSSGVHAQQDVPHFHVHIVPRHRGDGQDIRWTTHPELRARFDELLARLRDDAPTTPKEENPLTWRYAICNELFEGWTLGRVARFCRDLGYEGLELAPYTLAERVDALSADDRAAIRREIEDEGMRVVGLHWLLARTEGLQLNDADPETRERTVRYLLSEIDLCADLGGDVLVLGSPAQRAPGRGVSYGQAWTYTAEAMRRCGQHAHERGVTFCIEALPEPECSFITDVAEAARLVRQVDTPGFCMIVDVKAMAHDPPPLGAQVHSVGALTRHVHVNDPNLLGPGMGDVDVAPVLRALHELGYDGWVSVEAFDADYGVEAIARDSIANLWAADPRFWPTEHHPYNPTTDKEVGT